MNGNIFYRAILRIARHLILAILCLSVVFPVVWMVLTSFKPANEIFSLRIIANHPTLENYAATFTMLPFARLLLNTFLMAALVSVGTVIISICAAYAFARWEFPGSTILFLLFVGTLLIPAQVTMLPNYLLLARLGWLNTLAGLTIPQLASGFGVFYLRQQFKSFPREIFDASAIDGANALRSLWSMLLPNMHAALATLTILIFVQTWNEYFWPLLVLRDPDSSIVQVGLQTLLQEGSGNNWGVLMAATALSLLPMLMLYTLAQRQIKTAFLHA